MNAPLAIWSAILCVGGVAFADEPRAGYLFPAGGQRGTTVPVRVGAYNFHESANLHSHERGVTLPKVIRLMDTVWFEGPLIRQPASQRKEDYPRDFAASAKISADASLGPRFWHLSNSQGVTSSLKFVVGDLPEITEQEIDGSPIPVGIPLPVTINGRIFPREDVDIWTCELKAGQQVTCEVNAQRLGSPLDSRLEIIGPDGRRLAENTDAIGKDSRIRFTAPIAGRYAIHIHDADFNGLQNHVYRLTVTDGPWLEAVYPLGGRRGQRVKVRHFGNRRSGANGEVAVPADAPREFLYRAEVDGQRTNGVLFDVDDLPEQLESDASNDTHETAARCSIPVVVNGRIEKPGDADCWAFTAKKGEKLELEVRAARLGSPLDSVLTVLSEDGRQLATNDDKLETDSRLSFTVPADGRFVAKVQDRFASRGGERFAYRLRIAAKETPPGFKIKLPADAFTLTRGTDLKIKVAVERAGGFAAPVTLKFNGLPAGVTAAEAKIPKNKSTGQIILKADDETPIQVAKVSLVGIAKIGEDEITSIATCDRGVAQPPADEVWLAVAIPTPFKVTAAFATKYANKGSVYFRHFRLERGGFDGPLIVRLADVQARHLQGVTGPVLELGRTQAEFEYPITLPPKMEVGRTSRTCVLAVGTVTDFDGSNHQVCYSSTVQQDQIIVLVDPGRLSIEAEEQSVTVRPGQRMRLPFTVKRGVGLSGGVDVSLKLPAHIKGVAADPVRLAAGKSAGELTIRFAKNVGPFNMPLQLRAVMSDERGLPVTAETPLEFSVSR